MKKIFLSAIIITIFSLASRNDLTDIEINTSGFKWEVSSPNALGLNGTMLNSALSEASARGFINSVIIIRNGKIAAE